MSDYDYGSATILIVDDEPNNLKLLYDLLIDQHFEVRAARDGETALAAVQDNLPDLILLDIKMPTMDGYEVCRRLKENAATREVPVIFISALNQVTDVVKAFQMGGIDYITKPFQLEEVLARVRTHLTLLYQRQHLAIQNEQIEAMRRKDRQRFDKITQMREHFVRAAAHDLKNPLGIIMGYADIMQRLDLVRSEPNLKHIAEEISRSSDTMLELVTDILEIMQLQSDYSLSFEDVNLQVMLTEHVEKHRFQALEHGIVITLTMPDAPLLHEVDAQYIQRAFDNLVSNAIKYSPDDTQIEIRLSATDEHTVLEVSDEGYGIDADVIGHLFDPFFRAPIKGKTIEGTGLGLAIVKEIVEQHRGRITVNSTLGAGSTFRITLPRSAHQ